jgi:hypothetical protein
LKLFTFIKINEIKIKSGSLHEKEIKLKVEI